MSTNNKPNYRIYDLTGGGATKDIYAESLEAAIEAGREWIEDGEWASEEGVIRKGKTLDASVREIVTRPENPLDIVYSLPWDLWSPEWDNASIRWFVDVSDIHDGEEGVSDAEERNKVAEALGQATGGRWEYHHDGERCVWVDLPADWPTKDITDEQDEHDCSGSYSDDEPECESEGLGKDEGGHDWRSPYSLLGGLKENPGVWGGVGTQITTKTVCACCGKYRTETDLGWQRNPGDPESVVEYSDADEDSEAWLVRIHEEDGWIPQWLAEQLDRPITTRFTEEQAKQYVAEHMDSEDKVFKLPGNSGYAEIKAHEDDDLEHVFAALAGRKATDEDRGEGLWSHCAQLAS